MPDVHLPLSGAVTQAFEQMNALFSPSGNQVSLFSVNVGQSTDEATERAVIADVASYGKQLGRIGDALRVLLKFLPLDAELDERDRRALRDFESIMDSIDDVKRRPRDRR